MPPQPPAPEQLTALAADLPAISAIRWVPETGSTNADLLADGRPGEVLVADVQTAGRGRHGRTWTAPPGSSLLLSLRLEPGTPLRTWALLPLVAGSALVEAARAAIPAVDPARLRLKWPNDLLIDGVKAAGILVEAGGAAAVVGIGLNVDWRGLARPPGVEATSLAEVAGGPVDRWAVLPLLLRALDAHLARFAIDPAGAVQRYLPDCGTIGGQVIARTTPEVRGTAVGLTADGHLRIRADDGRDHVVAAGDVEHLR